MDPLDGDNLFPTNYSSGQLPELHDVASEHSLLQGEEQGAAGGGGECTAGSSQVKIMLFLCFNVWPLTFHVSFVKPCWQNHYRKEAQN